MNEHADPRCACGHRLSDHHATRELASGDRPEKIPGECRHLDCECLNFVANPFQRREPPPARGGADQTPELVRDLRELVQELRREREAATELRGTMLRVLAQIPAALDVTGDHIVRELRAIAAAVGQEAFSQKLAGGIWTWTAYGEEQRAELRESLDRPDPSQPIPYELTGKRPEWDLDDEAAALEGGAE